MSEASKGASRINGAKSKGPTSQKGKNRAKLNALKDGIFSSQVIVTAIGERAEDFEKLQKRVLDYFKPANIVEEMLVVDLVENWWRRQRIKRVESADIATNVIKNASKGNEKERAISSLRSRFLEIYNQKIATLGPNLQFGDLGKELDEVRLQLRNTSSGISFLIDMVESVRKSLLYSKGAPANSLALLAACAGPADANTRICANVVDQAKQKAQVKRTEPGESQPSPQTEVEFELDALSRQLLEVTLLKIVTVWSAEREVATARETMLRNLENNTAALPRAKALNRISRAEAAADRRFYKALLLLLALSGSGAPLKLPPMGVKD